MPSGTSARWYHPVAIGKTFLAHPRVLVAITVGVVAFVALPSSWPPSARTSLSWDAAALVYLLAAVRLMAGSQTNDIRERAAEHDESALIIPIIVIAAIAASFAAVVGVLSEAKAAEGGLKAAYLTLAGSTILLSWSVMQIVFTFHYAHEFYAPPAGDGEPEASLGFQGSEKPDYWDFLYFAATVGATSQTSDIEICTRKMRRLVISHAIISFFFNTIVLALTINIAASLI